MITRIAAGLLLTAFAIPAQKPAAGNLQATLARLDESSRKFVSVEASLHRDDFTYAVRDHEAYEGLIYTVRGKNGSEVGIKMLGKGARTVSYKNGTARIFMPESNCFNSYSAADRKGTIESLLALDFGASGKDLAASWDITDLGPDTIDGVKVEKLDLVPKEAGLRNNITHVELWTDLARAISLKQVIYTPSKDTQTATYTNIRLNQSVDTKPFEIKGKSCGK
jgi:outer membrane lipoprotein-sorting protein